MEQTHALGRRKAAVARVYLTAGKGNVTINDRPLEDYFKEEALRYIVNQPFAVTGTEGQFDTKITLDGALCIGIACAQQFSTFIGSGFCAGVDIGGGTTDIAVVEDGGVEGTKMFSIGGRSFTHQIAESLGVDFETAEEYKLDFDTGKLDDRTKSKIETAISHNLAVWLTGVQVALEEFESSSSLPRNIMLCGGGASLSLLQETLAISDWYEDLPFSRRPVVHLIDVLDLPNLIIKENTELDHSFATALGLLRVGVDTLAGAPEENKLRAKISKLLQK